MGSNQDQQVKNLILDQNISTQKLEEEKIYISKNNSKLVEKLKLEEKLKT